MSIDERYRSEAFKKVRDLGESLEEIISKRVEIEHREDLELGVSFEVRDRDVLDLWYKAVRKNCYMDINNIEILEHHDGVYLKVMFINAVGNYRAERHVSIWSNGKVDFVYGFLIEYENFSCRIDEKDNFLRATVRLKN